MVASKVARNNFSLFDLQNNFINSIFDQKEHGLAINGRFQLYRDSIFVGLADALSAVYPTVHQLVGEDFFYAMARAYVAKHPSTSRNLNAYGDRFANFIAEFEPANSLPYLAEVAQLEWGYHQVFYAADEKPLDIKALEAISEEKYPTLKFQLHPASQLFSFSYPIYDIVRLCQQEEGSEETIDLMQGSQRLLVIRRQQEVVIEILSKAEFTLLLAFARGSDFLTASHAAYAIESNFDLITSFKQHVLQGTITGFSH